VLADSTDELARQYSKIAYEILAEVLVDLVFPPSN
jgi:hypothetical protein